MLKLLSAYISLFAFSSLYFGSNALTASEVSLANVKEGQRTFTVHCVQCHGLNGKGGGHSRSGPSLTDNITIHGDTLEDISNVISEGVPNTGMPKWKQKMPPTRIRDLALFVLSITGTELDGGRPNQRDILNANTVSEGDNKIPARSLFRLHCAQCHGVSGAGGVGPNLTDSITIHGNESSQIRNVIANGVADKLMPAWSPKLDDATIDSLTAYVFSIKDTDSSPPPTPEVSQAKLLDPELQARITEGKRTFMVHCVECHGNGGMGGMGPNLTDEFTLHGGKLEDFAATITNGVGGAGMPRWGTKLSPERIGDLAEYIYSITGSKPTGVDPGARVSRLVNSKYMRPRVDAESLKSGKRTFVVHCEQCHGMGGRGGAGPNLTDEFTLHGETYDDILRVIVNGIPAMQMPTWSQMLSKERIRDVAEYVLTLMGSRPTGVEPDSQRPEGLQGLSPFR